MPGAQRPRKQGAMTMKTILITAAAVLALSSGAFAWENSSKAVYGDASPYISGSTSTMTTSSSAAISVPAAEPADFVQTMRDR